ncbi:hypothetical protein ACFPYI_20960 [Halomarina salina]|uniref:Uncharacterized protein n=1 Tax=Halomarina salina TaxID=1872699 RepID=A0ABD5RTC7_9EURY|nr:hypothetical protein [Halomarina salina]
MARPTKRSLERRLADLVEEETHGPEDGVELEFEDAATAQQVRQERDEFTAGDREHFSDTVAASIREAMRDLDEPVRFDA